LAPATSFLDRFRGPAIAVGGLTLLALLVRALTLDAKGFWEDEAATVFLVRMDFWDMLAGVPDRELAPPLYYVVAWVWTGFFGEGEVGIRSLSAVIGAATVPVVYLAARELVSIRAAVVAAALVATNPLLVWFSQEARSYVLLAFLSAAALVFFARALRKPSTTSLALWSLTSALAIAAHYFAAFLFAAEAAWLLARLGLQRRLMVAAAAPVAVGAGLLALAAAQLDAHGGDVWFDDIPLVSRLVEIPGFFLVGFEAPYPLVLGLAVLAAALAAVGLLLLLRRSAESERRGAIVAGSIGLAAIVLPLAVWPFGLDVVIYKSVIGALPPLAIVVAAGFAAEGVGRLGYAAAAALVALMLAVSVATGWEDKYQRESWREAADAIGEPEGGRAIVATPGSPAQEPLLLYLDGSRTVAGRTPPVDEIDVVALRRRELGARATPQLPEVESAPPAPVAGFRLVEERRQEEFLLFRYRSREPRRLSGESLRSSGIDPGDRPVVLVQRVER
jgi:4-amino-4-deoxy-L-arabinose transferase-like glycosyltransferase